VPRTARNCHKPDYFEYINRRRETLGAKKSKPPSNRAQMANGSNTEGDCIKK